ncbi:MAG: hypothetical protein JOZ65_26955, partial [Chloroflexi bacterium]|nr:hypothetical protein [Chloroflexota bacterium]
MDSRDPLWRLFIAIQGVRARLAPMPTRRRMIIDGFLQSTADTLDWLYVRARLMQRTAPAVQAQSAVIGEPQAHIDHPTEGGTEHALVVVWGWAVDRASIVGPGVQSVRIYLDGLPRGIATYGGSRHDVAEVFGSQFLNCGWRYALDLRAVPPGL